VLSEGIGAGQAGGATTGGSAGLEILGRQTRR